MGDKSEASNCILICPGLTDITCIYCNVIYVSFYCLDIAYRVTSIISRMEIMGAVQKVKTQMELCTVCTNFKNEFALH